MEEKEIKRTIKKLTCDILVSLQVFSQADITNEDLSLAEELFSQCDRLLYDFKESRKVNFQINDCVVDMSNEIMTITDIIDGEARAANIYIPQQSRFRNSTSFTIALLSSLRHATPEEVKEYKIALSFAKRKRKPFRIFRGDLVKRIDESKQFIVNTGNSGNWSKRNFVSGDYELIATAEELKEMASGNFKF